jgi:hypothetical protein
MTRRTTPRVAPITDTVPGVAIDIWLGVFVKDANIQPQ